MLSVQAADGSSAPLGWYVNGRGHPTVGHMCVFSPSCLRARSVEWPRIGCVQDDRHGCLDDGAISAGRSLRGTRASFPPQDQRKPCRTHMRRPTRPLPRARWTSWFAFTMEPRGIALLSTSSGCRRVTRGDAVEDSLTNSIGYCFPSGCIPRVST